MYSPFLAQMVVIRRCNLTCGYCNEFDETSDPIPTDVLKARIDRLKELGTFSQALLEYTPADLRDQFYTKKDCAPSCTIGCVRTQSAYDERRGQPNGFHGPKRLPVVTTP